ncbi:hypothetical protein CCR96_16585 [Halochromatium roseum]|nr:hypothetical protein [Halochromatium roseum]
MDAPTVAACRWPAERAETPRFAADLEDSYLSARLLAAGETGLPETPFPPTCPFSAEQLLDQDYWPEAQDQAH